MAVSPPLALGFDVTSSGTVTLAQHLMVRPDITRQLLGTISGLKETGDTPNAYVVPDVPQPLERGQCLRMFVSKGGSLLSQTHGTLGPGISKPRLSCSVGPRSGIWRWCDLPHLGAPGVCWSQAPGPHGRDKETSVGSAPKIWGCLLWSTTQATLPNTTPVSRDASRSISRRGDHLVVQRERRRKGGHSLTATQPESGRSAGVAP